MSDEEFRRIAQESYRRGQSDALKRCAEALKTYPAYVDLEAVEEEIARLEANKKP